ncbi:MAG: ATP-binding protein [Kofleriaceae bacterium]
MPEPTPTPVIAPWSNRQRGARLDEARFTMLVAGAVAVVLVAGMALWALASAGRDDADAERASELRFKTNRLIASMFDAETSQRGYLLTDDEAYRASYQAAATAARALLADLHAGATPDLMPVLAAIDAAVQVKLDELAVTVRLADADDRLAALRVVGSGAGRRAMDALLTRLEEIVARQTASRRANLDEKAANTRTAEAVIIAGSAVAVVALVFGIVALRRRTTDHAQALAALTQQASELERRRAELTEALSTLGLTNAALARTNRDLDQFAYVASHDLKAPLRGISSLTTWLEEDLGDYADAKIVDHLRLMRSRVERLELLIEGILAYSRAGRRDVDAETVDVGALVRRLTELVPPPDGVELVIAAGPWPTLTTVAVQLQQVWLNLIGNAYKHGRRPDGGGTVTLACDGPDLERGGWRFRVSDDGRGIEPRFHARIFEMFQRLESRDRVEGAGIGLAIVRKLVTGNRGTVWIESSPGRGTAFCFTWSDT